MPRGARQTSWGGDGTVVAPDSVRVVLPFEAILTPNATLGSLYSYQFRGNSVYDPDYTGSGAQPTGFDQWSAFYNEYCVLSSRVDLECLCTTAAGVEYVVYPSYNANLPSTTLDASSRPYAQRCFLLNSGNGVKGSLRSSMSTAQMMGVREEAIVDDDAYGATVAANPGSSAVWYWTVVAQNKTNTTTLGDAIRIRICYDVLFHDRVQLSLSSSPKARGKGTPSCCPAGAGEQNNDSNSASAAAAPPAPGCGLLEALSALQTAVDGLRPKQLQTP